MSREYRVCLGKYAEKLRFRLPVPEIPHKSKTSVHRLTNAQEYRLLRIVATCVYCLNTVPKLEEIMQVGVRGRGWGVGWGMGWGQGRGVGLFGN